MKVECAHSHPIHDLTAIRLGFPKAEELIQSALKGPRIRQERALAMAYHLDAYIENKMPHELHHAIEKAISKAQKASATPLTPEQKELITERVVEQIRKKVGDSLLFFVTVDPRKGPFTPIERIAENFEFLPLPEDPTRLNLFEEGIEEFSRELIRRAFDQHLDNPEQYVSHGFDHSINTANYTREVLKMNPEIVLAAQEKYHITAGEAQFMLETIALLHDCGYPCIGCKAKSVHGISGADLMLPMRPIFEKLLTSPDRKRKKFLMILETPS